jgi:peroxiredoxin/predicted 2-oxoglutarate/Fe(II)-dependent dioxygenase YbiX
MPSAGAATTAAPPDGRQILPGDPAPWFQQRTTNNPNFAFQTVGGRYVLLCFYATAGDAAGRAALDAVAAHRALFDDERMCVFGVSLDPADVAEGRIADSIPGIRHFLDFDATVSRQFGLLPAEGPVDPSAARRIWVLLDPMLRTIAVFPLADDAAVFAALERLPAPERFAGFEIPPPVLVLPNVFEPALCRHLIGLYDADGGRDTGVMRDVDGKTVEVRGTRAKKRRDFTIEDQQLIAQLQARFRRRVIPEIEKVHYFRSTRMERYIVSCYSAEEGGVFTAHRDNLTAATAHRRFAVSINLNAEFEGGEVSFPEYSPRGFKAPPGGAVVFSCTLLHAVSLVTAGRRYAFLPFLYDEEAARIREANAGLLAEGSNYKANAQPR